MSLNSFCWFQKFRLLRISVNETDRHYSSDAWLRINDVRISFAKSLITCSGVSKTNKKQKWPFSRNLCRRNMIQFLSLDGCRQIERHFFFHHMSMRHEQEVLAAPRKIPSNGVAPQLWKIEVKKVVYCRCVCLGGLVPPRISHILQNILATHRLRVVDCE